MKPFVKCERFRKPCIAPLQKHHIRYSPFPPHARHSPGERRHQCTRHHHKLLSTCQITHWFLLMKHLKMINSKPPICEQNGTVCYRRTQHYMQHPGEQPMRIIHRFLHLKTIGELFHKCSRQSTVFALHIKHNR